MIFQDGVYRQRLNNFFGFTTSLRNGLGDGVPTMQVHMDYWTVCPKVGELTSWQAKI